jgi:peroxiredoxin
MQTFSAVAPRLLHPEWRMPRAAMTDPLQLRSHLLGQRLPRLEFQHGQRVWVNLGELAIRPLVLYFYPGRPVTRPGVGGAPAGIRRTHPGVGGAHAGVGGEPAGAGGAHVGQAGQLVEPESVVRALRWQERCAEIAQLGVELLGFSSQSPRCQEQLGAEGLLSFRLMSDPDFELAASLGLPTTGPEWDRAYQPLTLIAQHERIAHLIYPVSPESEAADALAWLRENV